MLKMLRSIAPEVRLPDESFPAVRSMLLPSSPIMVTEPGSSLCTAITAVSERSLFSPLSIIVVSEGIIRVFPVVYRSKLFSTRVCAL